MQYETNNNKGVDHRREAEGEGQGGIGSQDAGGIGMSVSAAYPAC